MTTNLTFRTLVVGGTVALAVFCIVMGWPINLGIDLRGGSILTYEVERLAQGGQAAGDVDASLVATQDLDDTISVISDRINKEGLKDISVRREGNRQFAISMAGFTEEQSSLIRKKMTQVGQLEFPIVCSESYPSETYRPFTFNKAEFDRQYFDSLQANRADKATPVWQPPAAFKWAARRPQRAKNEDEATYVQRLREYDHKLLETPWELKDEGDWLFYSPRFWNAEQGLHGFSGRDIESPIRSSDDYGLPAVTFNVKESAQNLLSDYSQKFEGKAMALVLNGEIWSSPTINSRLDTNVQISGGTLGFTKDEQTWLINCLQSGSLKLKPRLLSTEQIAATLGAKSIQRGTLAFILGGLLVVGFMIIYYRIAGVLAVVSQFVNFAFIFGTLILLDASLTLPGIAGLVLTIGMAVDASILEFERIREELAKGKTLIHACENGFDRAFITIFDSNLTTFVPAAFLVYYGKGPIKGFGYTLMVGIVCTVFATTYGTRTLMGICLKRGWIKELRFRQLLNKTSIPFSKFARRAAMSSLIVIAAGLVVVGLTPNHTKYGLDFNGGTNVRLQLRDPMSRSDVLARIATIKNETGAVKYENADAIVIDPVGRVSTTIDLRLDYVESKKVVSESAEGHDEFLDIQREIEGVIGDRLAFQTVTDVTYDPTTTQWSGTLHLADDGAELGKLRELIEESNALSNVQLTPGKDTRTFGLTGQTPAIGRDAVAARIVGRLSLAEGFRPSNPFPHSRFLGQAIVADLTRSALVSAILSLLFILGYTWFRFKELEYGVAATVALIHDVLVALGFTVAFNALGLVEAPISLDVLAAFLTIIGFSLNDTIVLFDRIRENLGNTKGTFVEIVDRSVNQTLSRTILTSLTVFLTVFAVFVTNYGIESPLEGFSFTMMIGTIAGTYSTVYIASTIVIWFNTRNQKKQAMQTSGRSATATTSA